MQLVSCILLLLVILTLTDDTSECATKERHRKPWHQLTVDEQMLYVSGFQKLRSNGVLEVFVESHHLSDTPLAFADVHYTAQFFPWHSYFLTEIETQIRALGGEYSCFALPYWDFTTDSGHDIANDMPIYQTVLGSDGNIDNDYCVEDALWNRDVYHTTYLCSDNEIASGINNCCLKRGHGLRGHIPSSSQISPHIYSYHRWQDFQETIVKEHTYVHGFVAHLNSSHMFGHNAAEDPLFIMLHNFLMYIRALRTTCFGYDLIINELEQYQPYAYDPYQDNYEADMKPFVDVPMDFNVLSDAEWSTANKEDITVRKVFDLKYFDITYELGTFWHNDPILQKYCADNLNKTWFYDDNSYIYNDQKQKQNDILSKKINNNLNLGQTKYFNNIYYYIIGFCIFFGLTVIAIINKYGFCENQKYLITDNISESYGTFHQRI